MAQQVKALNPPSHRMALAHAEKPCKGKLGVLVCIWNPAAYNERCPEHGGQLAWQQSCLNKVEGESQLSSDPDTRTVTLRPPSHKTKK